ncbi:unnamed protein product [Cyprideis torosa]|uniref:Uncharacterized protein n=1 Tax=Cyprideis torosa TaxID=163714 RepID=A0A7R8W5V7_9CRUS|nr:unnamed protein product [Cyprideis torosa]CAG0883343.1 unnamed protein product [Cyprideis torosa]
MSNKASEQQRQVCYCNKDRNLNIIELWCLGCRRWFHESCISYQLGKLVPFMLNYAFYCKNCSPSGLETFRKIQAQFQQMCITALANLQQYEAKEGRDKTLFSVDKDILPFIEMHWEGLTTMSRRVTNTWHQTISRTLQKDLGILFRQEVPKDEQETEVLYGLKNTDVTQIHPATSEPAPAKARGGKRRTLPGGDVVSKKARGENAALKLMTHGYPVDHPFNKDGFRYVLAEPDPNAPHRQEFDEMNDWQGRRIPSWLYRAMAPSQVMLALHDRATQLKVTEGRTAVTGDKGYASIRATHFVSRGTWYYEATITEMAENAATRIGFAQALANLQAPIGFDKFGYSWRSRKGTKFHDSRGLHYSDEGYGKGDTLGFLIHLPVEATPTRHQKLPPSIKDRPLVRFKNHLYFEEREDAAEEVKKLTPLPNSYIKFFRNGEDMRVAFEGIYDGQYYPALGLYRAVTVSLNFGPDFKFPPPLRDARPFSDRAQEYVKELSKADTAYLTENYNTLRLE